jgi:hypothetical protein
MKEELRTAKARNTELQGKVEELKKTTGELRTKIPKSKRKRTN